MNKFLTTCAAAALSAGLLAPVYAQDSSQPASPATTDQQTAPQQTAPQQTAPSTQNALPSQADLTGQMIYSSKGSEIGTVSSVTTDANGQQVAIVRIEKFLGMGGKDVQFPVGSLTAKSGGGYTTSLTSSEIKKLSATKTSTDQKGHSGAQ